MSGQHHDTSFDEATSGAWSADQFGSDWVLRGGREDLKTVKMAAGGCPVIGALLRLWLMPRS